MLCDIKGFSHSTVRPWISPRQPFLMVIIFVGGASSQVVRSAIGFSFTFGLMAEFKWLFYTPSTGTIGSPEAHPDLVLTSAAVCTGIVEATLYNPFEITMIRMQTKTNSRMSTWQYARQLYLQYGLHHGLYRGYVPTCCREMLGNTAYFFSYEKMKEFLHAQDTWKLNDTEIYGISGAFAGLLYWISYPFDTVKCVIQADAMDPSKRKYGNMSACFRQLYSENRIPRFFKGLSPCLARTVPVNAVQFITFEKSVQILTPLWPDSRA